MTVVRVAQKPWLQVKSFASAWGGRMNQKRSLRYALAGAVLALGAPLGWLVLRGCTVGFGLTALAEELAFNLPLYLYLLVATAIAFTAYGARTGVLADRLVESNQRLQELVSTDALTALKNARYFRERIRIECARTVREERGLVLILADLDHFKGINDAWGHAVGDEALIHATEVIANSLRAGDVACRIGGEEFGIICPGATLEEGSAIAERIRANLEASPLLTPVLSPDAKIYLTTSLGVAVHRPNTSPEMLFRLADEALYSAKRLGRNQVHCDGTRPPLRTVSRAQPAA